MARLFFDVTEQPFVSGWEKGALTYTDNTNDVKNITACINVIKSLPLPELPEDIWDLVVWYILRYTPKLNNTPKLNILQWMFNWISDPLQQLHNKMPIYPDIMSMMVDALTPIKNIEQACLILESSPSLVCRNRAVMITNVTYLICGNRGDLFLGISIKEKDRSNIINCSLCIGGNTLADYLFTDEYKINGYGDDIFYYNPQLKIVPSRLLRYHQIEIKIQLKPDTKISSLKTLHSTILKLDERHKLLTHPYVFEYQAASFVIANNMSWCSNQIIDMDDEFIMIK